MTTGHGLSEATLRTIHQELARHPEVEMAIIYGSRAKGTHRPGSDIDLVLVGAGVTDRTLSELLGKFEDGPLPYAFDVSAIATLTNQSLLEHIKRVGVVLYERRPAA